MLIVRMVILKCGVSTGRLIFFTLVSNKWKLMERYGFSLSLGLLSEGVSFCSTRKEAEHLKTGGGQTNRRLDLGSSTYINRSSKPMTTTILNMLCLKTNSSVKSGKHQLTRPFF